LFDDVTLENEEKKFMEAWIPAFAGMTEKRNEDFYQK
jgi:hypothetical protein